MIVDIKDLEEWRKQNPNEKSVLLRHGDSVARWNFGAKKQNEFFPRLGQYTCDGDFVFYDKDGNRHTCFNEMKSKMILNNHELWKKEN